MHAAGWIEVRVIWHGSDDDPATLHFGDVVSEGPGHRVERQGSVDEALDKLQAARRFLLLLADPSVAFPCNSHWHSRPPRSASFQRRPDYAVTKRRTRRNRTRSPGNSPESDPV